MEESTWHKIKRRIDISELQEHIQYADMDYNGEKDSLSRYYLALCIDKSGIRKIIDGINSGRKKKKTEYIFKIAKDLNYVLHHTPHGKLGDDERAKIQSEGLVHFCSKSNVDGILQNGVIAGKSVMNPAEKGLTWFYIYDEKNYKEKRRMVFEKGRDCLGCVIVKGLSDGQIANLRIRKCDKTIVYKGNLKTNKMEEKTLEKDFFLID